MRGVLTRTSGVCRTISSFSKRLQVKYHGEYSLSRAYALSSYCRSTSTCRALVVALLSPVPSVVACALADAVKLPPASTGLDGNLAFIARFSTAVWLMACLSFHDFRRHMRTLPFSNTRLFVSSTLVSLGSTTVYYFLARRVGFPLPYSPLLIAVIAWLPLMITALLLAWGRVAWENARHRQEIVRGFRVWTGQACLSMISPLCMFAFNSSPVSARFAIMLALPVMKLTLRAGFSSTLPHLRDLLPEVVTLNAGVFSSLFITYAMQTTALSAAAGLMTLDVLYMLVSTRDMERQIREIRAIEREMDRTQGCARVDNSIFMLERADQLASKWTSNQDQTHSPQFQSNRLRSRSLQYPFGRVAPAATALTAVIPVKPPRHPLKATTTRPTNTTRDDSGHERDRGFEESTQHIWSKSRPIERRYVLAARRFLFTMEYVLLLNYVEACIPIIYASYLVTGFYLPNRAFYAQLANVQDARALREILVNVLLYGALQVATLTVVSSVYRWRASVSGARHLAFVLERQWDGVQVTLVFWVFYNAQASLEHFGFDFTFRFAWLRAPPPVP